MSPPTDSQRSSNVRLVHARLARNYIVHSMAPRTCVLCEKAKAMLKRPKTGQQICRDCFFYIFETEVHNTITQSSFFNPGDRVAIGASGGKGTFVIQQGYMRDLFLGFPIVGRFDCPCICYEDT